jgi:hypothetical protein
VNNDHNFATKDLLEVAIKKIGRAFINNVKIMIISNGNM